MTDNENEIDPTADTVPIPDAPCDEPGCSEPWATMVQVFEDKLYLCPEHAKKARDARVD